MKTNPFSKTLSITIVNSDQARKRPICLVVKKYLLVSLCLLVLCAIGIGIYAGVSAYFFADKLSKTVDGLYRLISLQPSFSESEQDNAVEDEFDLENLSIITGGEIQYSDPDSALMSDPWLEIESTANSYSIEMESGSKNGRVELLSWSDMCKDVLPRGTEIVVVDVDTGLSFKAKRLSGTFHSDTDPLTKEDTKVFKQIYGGRWSWTRRAIWVKIDDRYFAASMNGMPHANSHIPHNGFPGHFCIHFMNSRVHQTKRACPVHQSMIVKAYSNADLLEEYIKNNQY